MKALLQAIDNQWLDLPLITALQLVTFGFDEWDLAAIRLQDNRPDVSFASLFHRMCGQDTELGRRCLQARQRL